MAVAFGLAAMGVLAEACGQPAPAESAGGTCEQSTDCQEGYVCITQPDGTRQCSNDLSSIQTTEEAGAEAAAQQDGSTPDTGLTPPADGNAPPVDSTAPPQDTGTTQQDTGTPPKDTGSPPQDTGSPPQDTGSPPQDTGTSSGGGDAPAG